jgi:hypothetical protein
MIDEMAIINLQKKFGDKIHTSGPKTGRSLSSHLINVALVAHQIADILRTEGILNTEDAKLTFYSGLIHDMNKIEEKSLRRSITKENIKEVFKELEISEEFDDENIEKIQLYSSLHQKTGPVGMELLIDNKKEEIIFRILRIADKIDLFNSADLRKEPGIVSRIEEELKEIRQISNGVFEYTKLSFHSIAELRGLLTETINENVAEYLYKNFEMIPIARFLDGTVYLAKEDSEINIDELIEMISSEIAGKIVSPDVAVEFRTTGIQIKDAFVELPLEEIVEKIYSISLTPGRAEKYETNSVNIFVQGLRTYLKAIEKNLPKNLRKETLKKFHELIRAKEPLEKLPTKLKECFKKISEIVSITDNDLDDLKEKFVSEFSDIHSKYVMNPILLNSLKKFLTNNLCVDFKSKVSIDEIAKPLETYGKYKTTCSICGESGEVQVIPTVETPSFTIQQFTNRLDAHKSAEPLRQVCNNCRLQMLVTKAQGFNYNGQPFVVLLQENFYPQEFLDYLKEKVEESNENNQTSGKDKEEVPVISTLFGNRSKPKYISFGNYIQYRYYGISSSLSKKKASTILAAYACKIREILPVKVLITANIHLLEDDVDFNGKINIQEADSAISKILEEPHKWAKVFDLYSSGSISPEDIFFIGQFSDDLSKLDYIVKSISKEKVMVELFKTFGGDKMEEMKKMAEMASKWAYSRSKNRTNISDHQYIKPFNDAINALRKFDPHVDTEEDLLAHVTEVVTHSLPNPDFFSESADFAKCFVEFVKKVGLGNFKKGRENIIQNFTKYKNIFLGNIKLSILERVNQKQTSREGIS